MAAVAVVEEAAEVEGAPSGRTEASCARLVRSLTTAAAALPSRDYVRRGTPSQSAATPWVEVSARC